MGEVREKVGREIRWRRVLVGLFIRRLSFDEFSNVSGGDASFGMDAMTEESMNLTGGRKDLSFGAPGSSKSGYMGNLWKARYGVSKSPMPR